MAKLAIYYDEAERLFVREGFSLDAICELLQNKVSRRTLFNWMVDGKWEQKRAEYLKQTEGLRAELVEIARIAIKNAKAEPTPKNIRAMSIAIAALQSFQGIKLIEEETTQDERKELTEETVKRIEKEVLGIDRK